MSQCRFLQREVAAELYEGEPAGTIVKHLEARSTSSLQFEIIRGNTDNRFSINPSTGVVTTNWPLDYESIRLYNLSVTATNMVSTIIIETTQLFCICFLFYVIPVVQSKIKVYVFNYLNVMKMVSLLYKPLHITTKMYGVIDKIACQTDGFWSSWSSRYNYLNPWPFPIFNLRFVEKKWY